MLLASAPLREWSLLSSWPTSRAQHRSLCQGDPTGRKNLSLLYTPIQGICQGQRSYLVIQTCNSPYLVIQTNNCHTCVNHRSHQTTMKNTNQKTYSLCIPTRKWTPPKSASYTSSMAGPRIIPPQEANYDNYMTHDLSLSKELIISSTNRRGHQKHRTSATRMSSFQPTKQFQDWVSKFITYCFVWSIEYVKRCHSTLPNTQPTRGTKIVLVCWTRTVASQIMPSVNHHVARASCWTSIIGLSQCDAEHPTYRTSELHHSKNNVNVPCGTEADPMLPDIDYQRHQITMLDPSHKAATARYQVFLTDIRQKSRPHHCYQSIMPDTIHQTATAQC